MQRVDIGARPDWVEIAEENDFHIHHMYGELYWDESRAYRFTLSEIENNIEDPTTALVELCYAAVDHIVYKDPSLMTKLGIPAIYHDAIKRSWEVTDHDLYGRFDLSYDGENPAKMLEFNADTPTSLYESAVFQWMWLEDMKQRGILPEGADQFNSIHEKLVEAFRVLGGTHKEFHFTGALESEEDALTVYYMADCAHQAGLEVTILDISDIGIDAQDNFMDNDDKQIKNLFKLYPLEHMFHEEFGPKLITSPTRIYEPLWKALLSNKGILPILWELFPDHPNLLPAYWDDDPRSKELTEYVRKPLLSREGENVTLVSEWVEGGRVEADGEYGEEGYVVQAAAVLPKFGDDYMCIGSWVVAGKACGIGIREDKGPITRNLSRFVPHWIDG